MNTVKYYPKALLAPHRKPLLIRVAPPFIAFSGRAVMTHWNAAFFVLTMLLGIGSGHGAELLDGTFSSIGWLVLTYLYFYAYPPVVAYYEWLERRRADA